MYTKLSLLLLSCTEHIDGLSYIVKGRNFFQLFKVDNSPSELTTSMGRLEE